MLDEVSDKLKTQFVGLDYIIDDVMKVVSAWYIFPEAQQRPCIINLWGLTGSGKTALVNALVDHLDLRKYYARLDMGEYKSPSRTSLKRSLFDDFRHFDKGRSIICFDEFQFARTIDSDGDESNNEQLRVVWELMDSGKLYYTSPVGQFYVGRAERLIEMLALFKSQGGEIKDGEVIAKPELFTHLFDSFYFDDQNDRYSQKTSINYLRSTDFVNGVLYLDDNETPKGLIEKKICSSNIDELIAFIRDLIRKAVVPIELNLVQSLVFVLGNLDEAYSMSADLDPDMDADYVHELTSTITVSEIKQALQKRFRAEQIARLGNNHFLYRSFSSVQFYEVIKQELNRLTKFTKEQLGWSLSFDQSMLDVIYSEGVIPTLGLRPLFTTINTLVQSRFGYLAIQASMCTARITSIGWSYSNSKFYYELKDENNETVSIIDETVELVIMKQRASVNPNTQAHTAVHEAGHAIVAALLFRIIPALVVSKSAAANSEGFCRVRFPKGPTTKDSLMMDIAVTLGGLAAEKLVFGTELTSTGVSHDISEASRLANNAVRRYAMGSDPIRLSILIHAGTQDYFDNTSSYQEESLKMIRDCLMVAEALLERNKLLLLKMSDYLTTNSRMDMRMIAEFVRRYSVEDWVNDSGFVEPEDYYSFDKILKEQLEELSVGRFAKTLSN